MFMRDQAGCWLHVRSIGDRPQQRTLLVSVSWGDSKGPVLSLTRERDIERGGVGDICVARGGWTVTLLGFLVESGRRTGCWAEPDLVQSKVSMEEGAAGVHEAAPCC
jgi:hypothetical protein